MLQWCRNLINGANKRIKNWIIWALTLTMISFWQLDLKFEENMKPYSINIWGKSLRNQEKKQKGLKSTPFINRSKMTPNISGESKTTWRTKDSKIVRATDLWEKTEREKSRPFVKWALKRTRVKYQPFNTWIRLRICWIAMKRSWIH